MKLDNNKNFQESIFYFEKYGKTAVDNLAKLRVKIIQNSRRDLLGSFYQVQNNLKRVSSQPRNEATIDELLNSLSIISNEIRQLSNTAENNLKPIVEKNEYIGNTETEVVSSTKSYDKSVESANKDEVLDDDLRKQIDRLYSISHEKYISIFRTFEIVKFNFPEDVYGSCLKTFNMIANNFKNIELAREKINDLDKLYEFQLQLAIVLEEFKIELEGYINEYHSIKKAVI